MYLEELVDLLLDLRKDLAIGGARHALALELGQAVGVEDAAARARDQDVALLRVQSAKSAHQ